MTSLYEEQLRSPSSIQKIELLLEKSAVGLSKLFAPDNSSLSAPSRKFVEEVANRDAFLTLMEVIDIAGIHKSDILSLIADANTLMVDFLPFGEEDERMEQSIPVLFKPTEDYLQWLHDNLSRTNHVLGVATDFFQSLYGNCLHRAHSMILGDEFSE